MAFKIAYCAGHGYNTAGKRTPSGEREWTFNNKNVLAFEKEMAKYEGVQLMRMDDPTGKTDVPLATRVKKANDWGADIYISFHHNANTGKWGTWTGVETYHWGSGKSLELAKLVHPKVVDAYKLRDRGLKNGSHLYIIKYTTMPAVLIEGGFMDSTIDIKKLRDDKVLSNSGILVAQAVASYGKLKKKTSTKPTPKPSNPDKLYRVRKTWADAKTQKGAYENRKSAEDLADKYKNEGYKVFDWNGKVVYDPTPKKETPKKEVWYRVRKTWADAKTQKGAFKELENAKEKADELAKDGYKVFNEDGKVVYTPKPKEETIIHMVVKGDTLWSISQKYDVTVEDIKEKNNLISNLISIGDKLIIKGSDTPKEDKPKENEPKPQEPPKEEPENPEEPKEEPKDKHDGHHDIVGKPETIADKMASFVKSKNPDAENIEEIAKAFVEVGNKYNIRGDIAFCQSIIETGWFKFDGGTAVTPDQHNYCGMGVTKKGIKGNSFATVEEGVTAQIQHLLVYATTKDIPEGEKLVDPRWDLVIKAGKRGIAPHWEDLSMNWAMNENYGQHILSLFDKLNKFEYTPPVVEEPEQENNDEEKQFNFIKRIIDYIFEKISEFFKK